MLNQILFDIGYQNADLLNDPSNLQRTITELDKNEMNIHWLKFGETSYM